MNEKYIIVDGEEIPNPDYKPENDQEIDYKEKFSQSSREAQRLLEEARKEKEARERLEQRLAELENQKDDNILYPGFENLQDEEKENLLNFAKVVEKKTLENLKNDPAIAFARQSYNENKWETAFSSVLSKFPELSNDADIFKAKYYNPSNVPENVESILIDLAKSYLFDKSRQAGNEDKSKRIDTENSSGGDKTPKKTSKTDTEWDILARTNPKEFERLRPQFLEDWKKF